jgi:hypothetical protein
MAGVRGAGWQESAQLCTPPASQPPQPMLPPPAPFTRPPPQGTSTMRQGHAALHEKCKNDHIAANKKPPVPTLMDHPEYAAAKSRVRGPRGVAGQGRAPTTTPRWGECVRVERGVQRQGARGSESAAARGCPRLRSAACAWARCPFSGDSHRPTPPPPPPPWGGKPGLSPIAKDRADHAHRVPRPWLARGRRHGGGRHCSAGLRAGGPSGGHRGAERACGAARGARRDATCAGDAEPAVAAAGISRAAGQQPAGQQPSGQPPKQQRPPVRCFNCPSTTSALCRRRGRRPPLTPPGRRTAPRQRQPLLRSWGEE